jgi:hypothetical protein
MVWALQVGSCAVAFLLALSILAVVVGLGMAARPESFAGLWSPDTAKAGMVLSLAGGSGILVSAILGRMIDLIRASLADRDA